MALKFLNKKGWHTGSLRNIENVWKAEQKHEAEQKKLEELRKQIQDERERSHFRLLQEQAGLVPKQERLDFLYDSGLAVGKGAANSSDGSFKALQDALPTTSNHSSSSLTPGALFEEDKPQSANDAWRKLHSDPLLLIRQREQEALARIKNNPVQMALIRKSVEETTVIGKSHDKKGHNKKQRHRSSKNLKHSSSRHESDDEEYDTAKLDKRRKRSGRDTSNFQDQQHKAWPNSVRESTERQSHKKKYKEKEDQDGHDSVRRSPEEHKHEKYNTEAWNRSGADKRDDESRSVGRSSSKVIRNESVRKPRNVAPKLSEEERATRLRQMQEDADLHEEQRWKRLKKADENDAQEASHGSGGRSFLDAAHRSVYGTDKGGSSTIEESVRRRTHYSQGRLESEKNAFRR